jgi:hypothetical protein
MPPIWSALSVIAVHARSDKNLFNAEVTMSSRLVTMPGKKYFVPVCALT